jgi:hypothetical protein
MNLSDPKVRQSAYRKQSVEDMSFEEMCAILITTDGKGAKMKEEALATIIKHCKMNFKESEI